MSTRNKRPIRRLAAKDGNLRNNPAKSPYGEDINLIGIEEVVRKVEQLGQLPSRKEAPRPSGAELISDQYIEFEYDIIRSIVSKLQRILIVGQYYTPLEDELFITMNISLMVDAGYTKYLSDSIKLMVTALLKKAVLVDISRRKYDFWHAYTSHKRHFEVALKYLATLTDYMTRKSTYPNIFVIDIYGESQFQFLITENAEIAPLIIEHELRTQEEKLIVNDVAHRIHKLIDKKSSEY